MHPLGMPLKRLETASAFEFPQLDAAIPARTGQPAAVGGKGQSPHPVAMPPERLDAGSRPALLHLPDANRALEAATGEPAPIRAPGQREDRTGMRHVLQGGAQRSLPEPDGGIMSATSEQTSIRSKGQTGGALGMPARPEHRATGDFPQLERAIQAPADQRAFVRAEGESPYHVRMGLPGQVQGLACLAPHPYFPPLAARGPVLSGAADGNR